VAKQAAHLSVFQRTANYSIPLRNGPLTAQAEQAVKQRYAALRSRVATLHRARGAHAMRRGAQRKAAHLGRADTQGVEQVLGTHGAAYAQPACHI
jgi:cation diffusion facilitator CzcD-associated flavoprotein CzcO